MEETLRYKHVALSPVTHRNLQIAAAIHGRKLYELADELITKGLRDLLPVEQPTSDSTPIQAPCDH